MQHQTPREMAARLDGGDARQDLRLRPRGSLNILGFLPVGRWVAQPFFVVGGDVEGHAEAGVPFIICGVVMRMRDHDRFQGPEIANLVDGVLVEESDHVPHDIAVGCLEYERPLADGELCDLSKLEGVGSSLLLKGGGIPWALSRRT